MSHNYLSWDKKNISDFSPDNIDSLYNQGFVFVRTGRGMMKQTRSLRVDLSKFTLSSENKRVLKKTENITLSAHTIPYADYNWTFGKMGHDFYETKFGKKTFSANKIKELITDPQNSNFNCLLKYDFSRGNNPLDAEFARQSISSGIIDPKFTPPPLGLCIAYADNNILHYCYPFYDLTRAPKGMGLGMMTRAIVWAEEQGRKYVYLGSFQRPSDVYKLQFTGLEWWDGENWDLDPGKLKALKFSII